MVFCYVFEIFKIVRVPVFGWRVMLPLHSHTNVEDAEITLTHPRLYGFDTSKMRVVAYLVREFGKSDILLRVPDNLGAVNKPHLQLPEASEPRIPAIADQAMTP